MNKFVRYVTLALLLVGWMVLLVGFAPNRRLSTVELSTMIWPYFWIGCCYASTFPLAVWIAWGDAPLVSRVPWGFGVSILLGLTASLGFAMDGASDPGAAVFQVLSVFMQAILLSPARKRLGWRIRIPGQAARQSNQFGIGSLLLLTAGIACLLGLGSQILGDQSLSVRRLVEMPVLALCIGTSVISFLVAAVGFPATGTILASWPRRRFAIWLIVIPLLLVLSLSGIGLLSVVRISSRTGRTNWAPAAMPPIAIAGSLTSLCATLLALRRCGYRPTRPVWQEMPVATEFPFAAGLPAGEEK